ncbi:hypothetical protein ACSZM4_19905 [Aeromonas caviae]
MHSHWLLRFDLHRLILALAVIGVLATFGNSFYAIYQAQRQLLIDSTLEANRVYATKLAASTETMLRSAQGQLAYGAARLAPCCRTTTSMDSRRWQASCASRPTPSTRWPS